MKKGEKIKVGVLFSLTGDLAVIETDSTRVVQYAIDEINKNGGVAGMEVQPVIIDAKSDDQSLFGENQRTHPQRIG